MRDLRRVRAASGGALFAGNRLSDAMIAELEADPLEAERFPVRTVRLDSDPREADAKLSGRPLWRAAEPGTDPALEAMLADDIAEWIARCDA